MRALNSSLTSWSRMKFLVILESFFGCSISSFIVLGIEFLYKQTIWTMLLIALLGGKEELGRAVRESLRGDMVKKTEGNLIRMKGGRNRGSELVGVLKE